MMRLAAIFDIDGTLLPSPSVEYRFFRYLMERRVLTVRHVLRMLAGIGSNRFYLAGHETGAIQAQAEAFFHARLAPALWWEGIASLRAHQAQGYWIILLSGTLDFLLSPLQRYLQSHLGVGTALQVVDGRFTGRLSGPHIYGEEKAACLARLQSAYRLDLERSYGYANHYSDYSFLRMVGHPIAVNPDKRLRARSRAERWTVMHFQR